MALNTYKLCQDVSREFRTQETDERFRADFVTAVNQALDDISIDCDLDTPLSHINSADESVTGLSEYHYGIIKAGCVFFLIVNGSRHRRGDEQLDVAYGQWEDKKAQYWTRTVNDLQRETESGVIDLGYLGDN